MTKWRLPLVGALLMADCSKQPAVQAVHTIEFFRQNEADRTAVLQKCEHGVDGFETQNSEECGNAFAARAMEERAADVRRRKS